MVLNWVKGFNDMNASELYAASEGKRCEGKRECHWCGSACDEKWLHDEPPLLIGVRRSFLVARPGSPWICAGCWLWRRQRITVRFLDDTIRDNQSPPKHSWFISSRNSLAFTPNHHSILFNLITTPPAHFVLIIRTPGSAIDVTLQTAIVNETNNLTINTPLWFTLDNIRHQFSLYELDDAIRRDSTGKEPGVRVLATMFEGLLPKSPDEPPAARHAALKETLPDGRILGRRVGNNQ